MATTTATTLVVEMMFKTNQGDLMSELKYVVVEYYESDRGGRPGDAGNTLAIHRLNNGEVESAEDGAPTSKEEALGMLEAFNSPIYKSVDSAADEYDNVLEYAGDGDVSTDEAFKEAKYEVETTIPNMLIGNILRSIPTGTYHKLVLVESSKLKWFMKIVSFRNCGAKVSDELKRLGMKVPDPKYWVECFIYKTKEKEEGFDYVGSCLVGKELTELQLSKYAATGDELFNDKLWEDGSAKSKN
jgi:hypothetical protein